MYLFRFFSGSQFNFHLFISCDLVEATKQTRKKFRMTNTFALYIFRRRKRDAYIWVGVFD